MINIDFKDIEIMPLGYSSSGGGSSGGEIRNQSKSITIKENGTQSVTYDDGYTGLEQVNLNVDIDIPTFTTQNKVIDITENGLKTVTVDEGYDGITSIDINTNVKSGGGNFVEGTKFGYSNFSEIPQEYIYYLNTVSDMGYMFGRCYNLTSVTFDDKLNTSNVTNMKGMFYYCSGLTSLDLSSFDTSNVTDMQSMFSNCNGLTELDLSSFDTSKVTNMDSMFAYCNGLTELDLSSFDTSKVTSMNFMFNYCKDLDIINISNWNLLSLKSCTAFKQGSYLKEIIADNIILNDEAVSFIFKSTTLNISLKNADTSNVTNMSGMFSSCSGLTSLDLSSFNTSNVTNMNSMFNECRNLTSLDLSSFDTSKVTNMSAMFYKCSGLTSLDLNHFNTSNVTDMGSMFNYCSNLTSLDLSSFDTSKVTNMSSMFSSCSKLIKIDGYISFKSYSSSTMSSSYMFSSNTTLKKVTFKDVGYHTNAKQFNMSNNKNWGVNDSTITDARQSLIDSLITYSFDRATAGYSACTVTLSPNSKAVLTDDVEIASITAKGFTIA